MQSVDVSVSKGCTIITIDVALHPKDVDAVQDVLIKFWNEECASTKRCAEEFKELRSPAGSQGNPQAIS